MTGFSADWLSLREPADHGTRPADLTKWIAPALNRNDTFRILDLATGTGSNLRYLAPRLGGSQHWVLADHDARLLDTIPSRLGTWARQNTVALTEEGATLRLTGAALDCCAYRLHVDLAAHLNTLDFSTFDLVTTAALLDLVSDAWLQALLGYCAAAGCKVLFALSYDGRMEFSPAEPEDARVRELVNRHQQSDKGFGPALGPDAAARTIELLQEKGYEVRTASSDWRIDTTQTELQAELIAGWAAAAASVVSLAEGTGIAAWAERRLAHVRSGHSLLVTGHLDIAASPSFVSLHRDAC